MTAPPRANADVAVLVDRLAAHRTLGSAPRAELEWLAAHGQFRRFEQGTTAVLRGQPINEMVIQLTGRTAASVDRGTGRRHVLFTQGGDVSALLPFSRIATAIADVTVEETAEAVVIHRDLFPEMIRECPKVVETLVHTMLDRSRNLSSTDWQDDKMMSLGRLAAGLAHELNNPASAAARSAKRLKEALTEAHAAAQALGAARLTEEQAARLAALGGDSLVPTATGVFSAIERADQEDVIMDWLDGHGADLGPASTLSESGITTDTLDELAETFTGDALDAALRWIAAEYTTRTLATEVERATTRIHDLVSAVKRFTYMNRTASTEPTNIGQGLSDTVAMLAAKARGKSVALRLDVAANLPPVRGNAGELNQVWANLLENALDAVSERGEVLVSAMRSGSDVVVRVIDDGPGIPPDAEGRIFDPFFTTKPIGQGTGLGLDISRRIVQAHEGKIGFETRPGRTEFRVTLPVDRAAAG